MIDSRETVLIPQPERKESKREPVEPIVLTYTLANGQHKTASFTRPFLIGRAADCDVYINIDVVSRHHARVYPDGHTWRIKDQGSANGIFRDGKLITEAEIVGRTLLCLGHDGPVVSLRPHGDNADDQQSLKATALSHPSRSPFLGRHAVRSEMVRQTVQRVLKKHSLKYKGTIAALSVLLIVAVGAGVLGYLHLRGMAIDIFYSMKTIELEIAELEALGTRIDSRLQDEHGRLERQYSIFAGKLGVFDWGFDTEDKIIFRMARIFGECELEMPKSFANEVKKYIRQWRSSNRFETAIRRGQKEGYIPHIYNVLIEHNLPPQFLYLALQESNFRHEAVGIKTRWGIAKGMWQFIPPTALLYDLQTGPLEAIRKYDHLDDRHDFKKSTLAAARYLRDIYTTEARASGLLVMASYNWGEHRIIDKLRTLPKDPRQRNFWKFSQKHNMPEETYNYVLHIFSAAVIGENPRLFGFDFDNPLAGLERSPDTRIVETE